MPFYRRIPKRGFKNYTRRSYEIVNVGDLAAVAQAGAVTPEALRQAGLVRRPLPVKVLGHGELQSALQVSCHAASVSAREKIEHAGGRIEILKW
jgi:large subunit ribosomal protein L15